MQFKQILRLPFQERQRLNQPCRKAAVHQAIKHMPPFAALSNDAPGSQNGQTLRNGTVRGAKTDLKRIHIELLLLKLENNPQTARMGEGRHETGKFTTDKQTIGHDANHGNGQERRGLG